MAAKRLFAAVAALVAATAVLIGAGPAMAAAADGDGMSVHLAMPDEVHAGGEAVVMTMTIENKTDQVIRPSRVFTINLPGLKSNEAKFARQVNGAWNLIGLRNQNGALRATDGSRIEVPPHSQFDLQYALQLLQTAPSGDLRVSVTVTASHDNLKSDTDSESAKVIGGLLVGGEPTPLATESPTATPTDIASTIIDTPPGAAGGNIDTTSGDESGSGLPWFAYGIGIVLVLGGAGLFAFLWFNRGPEPAEYYEEVDPTMIRRAPPRVYGGAPHQATGAYDATGPGRGRIAPTQQLPAIGGPPTRQRPSHRE